MDELNTLQEKKSKRKLALLGLLFLFILLGWGAVKLGLAYNTIEVNTAKENGFWNRVATILTFSQAQEEPTPTPEENRTDILVLGMRGLDDPDAEQGGLLTDTILLFSHNKQTNKSAIVSIPRDLYINIGGKMDKANTVYEKGLAKKDGLGYSRRIFSNLTGVHIDNVVVFDFSSFKTIIDDLGGIDIHLEKPFEENDQWGNSFYIPAGENHLNGETALYYVRSRYSTNDFDRSRRQQQVIMAIKDKVMKLNYISDPIKTLEIVNSIRKNITTDLNIFDSKTIINLAKQVNNSQPAQFVMSTENLLYQSIENKVYILLPKGDDYGDIRKMFKEIVE